MVVLEIQRKWKVMQMERTCDQETTNRQFDKIPQTQNKYLFLRFV